MGALVQINYISLYLNQEMDFFFILWNIDNRVTLAQRNVLGFSIQTENKEV